MSEFDTLDWFTDRQVHQNPYPYYEYLRSKGPAVRLPQHNVVAVTDYELGLQLFRDNEHFSMVKAVLGPFPPLPFTPEGDDITAQIEAHRAEMPNAALFMSMDPPQHPAHRSLLSGLITPKRLKENEDFISRLCDRQISTFIDRDEFEVVKELGHPVATLVIADMLGLPEGFHERLLKLLPPTHATVGGGGSATHNPLDALEAEIRAFIIERRRVPCADVLTTLAQAKFPDGATPDVKEVANIASFMFAAGQDTTVRLIAMALQMLGDDLDLQKQLRADRGRIPAFVEEALRLESPSKVGGFRLAKVPIKIGDVQLAPGDIVMLLIGAMNRDPRRFENPNQIVVDRPNSHDQIAFGRGPHSCIGAPLARAEARIALNRIFDRTSKFWVSDEKHGPLGARKYEYMLRYTGRGPTELHVQFTRS